MRLLNNSDLIKIYLIRRKLFKVKVLISTFFIWINSFFRKRRLISSDKCVYIELEKPEIYQRYLYILVKYFFLSGYDVFLKRSLRDLYYINCDIDAFYLLKESKLNIGTPPKNINCTNLDDNKIKPGYFNGLSDQAVKTKGYYVPIGFHPVSYFNEFWKVIYEPEQRFNSIFMAGNFSRSYSNEYNEKLFGVSNRNKIKDILQQSIRNYSITNYKEAAFIEEMPKKSIVIVDRVKDFQIDPSKMFSLLNKFDFFLALPGLYMPLCHNIIESMSVGCIPFLQEGYANIFHPPLQDGINCITFKGTDDLNQSIDFLFALDQSSIATLRKGVLNYYSKFLSPESVVSFIVNGNFSKIYLMAEKTSVDMLAEQKGII